MTNEPETNDRTQHLLALMKRGDDAFNERDFAAMDAVHHPDMIAHVTGNAEPIYGRPAHAEAMKAMFRMFPDVHVANNPYTVHFGSGDWTTVISQVTGTFTGELALPDGSVIPPPESPSTSSSSRPSSGKETASWRSRPSGTPLYKLSRWVSPDRQTHRTPG